MKSKRILIPARMQSKRLPGKPLAMIGEKPLIRHVYDRATKTGHPVTILTDSQEIKLVMPDADVMITDEAATGTDRILSVADRFSEEILINCQGDLPFIDPMQILAVTLPLETHDISTLIFDMTESAQRDSNTVKAICSNMEGNLFRCHWFTRSSLSYGHTHAGVYAYNRSALGRIPRERSPSEIAEDLEQLRFLEHGLTMGAIRTFHIPGEVNTKADLELARRYHESGQGMGQH
mgnify:FL=1